MKRFAFRNIRNVEHEGFYHSSQGAPAENSLSEIDGHFNEQQAELRSRSAGPIKEHEAKLEQFRKLLPAAEARQQAVVGRLGNEAPEFFIPILMLVVGIFTMLAETVMLAPIFDAMGIADPLEQRIAAFAIGSVGAVIFHFGLESERLSRTMSLLARVLSAATLIFLIALGLARGRQAAFAGQLDNSPLSQFLNAYPVLTSIVFVFVTALFPLAAAVTFNYALRNLHDWREISSAHRAARILPQQLAVAQKKLEAEREKLTHDLKAIDENRKKYRQEYLVQHERGACIGGVQQPMWMVWLKATACAAVALIGCGLLFGLSPFTLLIPATVFLISWIYFYQTRKHPTPAQFYKRPNVQFRVKDETGASEAPLVGRLFNRKPFNGGR